MTTASKVREGSYLGVDLASRHAEKSNRPSRSQDLTYRGKALQGPLLQAAPHRLRRLLILSGLLRHYPSYKQSRLVSTGRYRLNRIRQGKVCLGHWHTGLLSQTSPCTGLELQC